MKPLILIADDDAGVVEILSMQLQDAGHQVMGARNGSEALALYRSQRPDLLLTDLRMPGQDGQALLESVLAEDPAATVVVMTAYATVKKAVGIMKAGAFDFIEKPFKENQGLAVMERALEVARLKRENRNLRRVLGKKSGEELESASPSVKDIHVRAESVADTDAHILILGETGTGKEHLALNVHRHSPRCAGPWIVVNCGALPDSLVEAELFGHTKGAFTGATRERSGRIPSADGGTLFLDEIGDLPLNAQVKLLRFLQEGEVYAVGSDIPVKVNARVIAATHKDLDIMAREGKFREDLYYRLNVITLRLPPLRERREDITVLAHRFLHEAAVRHGRDKAQLSAPAARSLEEAPWPGNIRQLKNLCERWALLYPGLPLTPGLLAPDIHSTISDEKSREEWLIPEEGIHLEELECKLIRQAMERTGGNKSRAARLLGITRHTLDYRLEKHRLP